MLRSPKFQTKNRPIRIRNPILGVYKTWYAYNSREYDSRGTYTTRAADLFLFVFRNSLKAVLYCVRQVNNTFFFHYPYYHQKKVRSGPQAEKYPF
jgi:hypothetical protein